LGDAILTFPAGVPFTASSHRRTQRRPTAAAPTDAVPFLIHRLSFAQTGLQQQSPLSSSSPPTSLVAASPSHHSDISHGSTARSATRSRGEEDGTHDKLTRGEADPKKEKGEMQI
jgi:hypothetical protein